MLLQELCAELPPAPQGGTSDRDPVTPWYPPHGSRLGTKKGQDGCFGSDFSCISKKR